MFHAHVSEFAELGWMGVFDVALSTGRRSTTDRDRPRSARRERADARFSPRLPHLGWSSPAAPGCGAGRHRATDAGLGDRTVPPIETLNVQRVTLPEPGLIELNVVNDGPDPITIAQVLVDDAYWQFTIDPAGHARPAGIGDVSIPYPWVKARRTRSPWSARPGVIFETEIPVAVESPAGRIGERCCASRWSVSTSASSRSRSACSGIPFLRRLGAAG